MTNDFNKNTSTKDVKKLLTKNKRHWQRTPTKYFDRMPQLKALTEEAEKRC